MSDQDFFFDEEEKPAAPQKAAKAGSKGAASAQRATTAPAAAGAPFFEQSVSMTVTSLVAVCAMLLGVIVGFVIKPSTPAISTGTTPATAPQLSQEQLNSGQLPPGHPDVGGGTGGAQQSPSAPATSGK